MGNTTGKGGFVKGQSGNPGGRPKEDNELKALAKAKTPDAFKRLVELLKSDDESIQLGAVKTIFEYGWGKPKQEMEVTGKDGSPIIPVINIGIPKPK